MPKPFASVIVPTFNQAQYLSAALESLIAQTDPSWEAIVVDDGSTDETPFIIQEYVQRDKRIVSIRKDNGGTSSALNLGLSYASGSWIHWLSSDDIFEPSKLAINRTWIERNPDCKFFFSYFSLLHEANGALERRGLWGSVPNPEYQVLTLLHRNYINGITVCIARDALLKVGIFDDSLFYAQDFDLWIRLLKRHKAVFIPEWTVISRVHGAQGSAVYSEACFFDTAMAAVKFLNASSFQDLVPWADLSNISGVLAAVHTALDVSFDPTSFLYGLGPHPGLVLKILDWICHAIEDPVVAQIAMIAVEERILEASLGPTDAEFNHVWRQLLNRREEATGNYWTYETLDPTALGLDLYAKYRCSGDPRSDALSAYLRRFDSVSTSHLSSFTVECVAGGRERGRISTGINDEEKPDFSNRNSVFRQIGDPGDAFNLMRSCIVRISEDARDKIAREAAERSDDGSSSIQVRLRSELAVWYAAILKSATESLFKQMREHVQDEPSSVDAEVLYVRTYPSSYQDFEEAFDRHLIIASGLFDSCAYMKANGDVAQARIDPLEHFLKFGGGERRNLGGAFDTERYLAANPDVSAAGSNPLVHFLRYGFLEGRGLECLKSVSDKIHS